MPCGADGIPNDDPARLRDDNYQYMLGMRETKPGSAADTAGIIGGNMRHKGIENQILELKTAHVMSAIQTVFADYGAAKTIDPSQSINAWQSHRIGSEAFQKSLAMAVKLALYELEG